MAQTQAAGKDELLAIVKDQLQEAQERIRSLASDPKRANERVRAAEEAVETLGPEHAHQMQTQARRLQDDKERHQAAVGARPKDAGQKPAGSVTAASPELRPSESKVIEAALSIDPKLHNKLGEATTREEQERHKAMLIQAAHVRGSRLQRASDTLTADTSASVGGPPPQGALDDEAAKLDEASGRQLTSRRR